MLNLLVVQSMVGSVSNLAQAMQCEQVIRTYWAAQ